MSVFERTSFVNLSYAGQLNFALPLIQGTTTADCTVDGTLSIGAGQSINPAAIFDTQGKVYASNVCFKADNETWPMNPLASASCTVRLLPTLAGSIVRSASVAISYTMLFDDYYIGVSNTSALRTISLPSNPVPNALYIIKDESLAAATNNITVNVNGATGTIDGATTAVISINGGSITLKADSAGVNYFIINQSISSGSGVFTWTVVTSALNPITLVKNNGYICKGASAVDFILPPAAAIGDTYFVKGYGNLWTIAQNATQTISLGSITTTAGVGGSITATQVKDGVEIICVTTNLEFEIITSIGNPAIA